MAGKKKNIHEVKSKWITIRLTEKEKEIITSKAESVGVRKACAYVRQTILSEITKPLHLLGETA